MSEESIKVAGAAKLIFKACDLDTAPLSEIDAPETNIHKRKTLHHCLGGVTPEKGHGCTFSILGQKYKPTSNLYNNSENIAYLDRLSNFQGQIIGGTPDDIMTFGDHVYGRGSIVILPEHLLSEFKKRNFDFLGELITFDPKEISLTKKIEEIIQSKPNSITFEEFEDQLDLELNAVKNLLTYLQQNKYLWGAHSQTSFRTLEHLLKPYYNLIDQIHSNSTSPLTLIPADRIACDKAIIRYFFEDLIKTGKKMLSPARQQMMQEWRTDTLSWLNLFSFDAQLRVSQNKTIFQTIVPFSEFIKYRSSWVDLERLAGQLLPVENTELVNLKFSTFFPEFLDKGEIVQSADTAGDLLHLKEFSTLVQLKEYLIKQGYSDQGHALVALKLLKDIESKFRNRIPLDKETYNLLQESIFSTKKIELMFSHLEQFQKNIIHFDHSLWNEGSLNILNSDLGKYIRERQGDSKETLTYLDLVNRQENLTILFDDSKENLEDKKLELKLKRLLRKKVWEKSFMNSGGFESNALVVYKDESSNMLGSINFNPFTINGLREMANFLSRSISIVPIAPLNMKDRWLPTLIQLGCCDSWEDLICKILPLENISELEMKAIIKHNVRLECEFSGKPIPHILKNLSLDKIDRWIKKYLGEVAKHQSYTIEIIEELRKNRKNFNPENHSFGDIVDQVNEVEKRMVIDSCQKHPYFYYRLDKTGNTDKLIIEPDVEQSKLLREHLAQRFDRASPAIKRVYQTHLNRLYKSPFDKAA